MLRKRPGQRRDPDVADEQFAVAAGQGAQPVLPVGVLAGRGDLGVDRVERQLQEVVLGVDVPVEDIAVTSSSAASRRIENLASPSASSSRTDASVIRLRSRPAGDSVRREREGAVRPSHTLVRTAASPSRRTTRKRGRQKRLMRARAQTLKAQTLKAQALTSAQTRNRVRTGPDTMAHSPRRARIGHRAVSAERRAVRARRKTAYRTLTVRYARLLRCYAAGPVDSARSPACEASASGSSAPGFPAASIRSARRSRSAASRPPASTATAPTSWLVSRPAANASLICSRAAGPSAAARAAGSEAAPTAAGTSARTVR